MGYRHNWRTTWLGKLDANCKLLVECIAVKYDAAQRSGWLDDNGFWQNPYCEGMIDAAARCTDFTEWEIKRAIGEYCAEHGLMPDCEKRPAWLDEHIEFVKECWEREDAAHSGAKFSEKPICASRKKLVDKLHSLGFQVSSGPNAVRNWVIKQDGAFVANIIVHAHRDGRCADYTICNRSWIPIQ